jgi:ribose transport system ATP-binding protein
MESMATTAGDVVIRDLRVSYGRRRVLRGVSLRIRPGEIHALLGANGAGKSTVIKCLGGGVPWEGGTIELGGEELRDLTPRQSAARGVAIIFQDLKLIGPRSVADNLLLGREPRRGPFLNVGEARRRARAALGQLGIDIDIDTSVESLSPALRQLVAIARALATEPRLLILDEATAALDDAEVTRLGELLRRLRATGVPILFVTHLLDEVFDLADSVTVLRDGEVVLQGAVADQDRNSVIEAIAGRSLAHTEPSSPPDLSGGRGLEVSSLTVGHASISLTVRPGEIVGLFGLIGCGRSEIAQALVGAVKSESSMTLDGVPYRPRSVAHAIGSGVAYIPPDRATQGIFALLNAQTNVSLPSARNISRWGWRSRGAERATFTDASERLSITPPDPNAPAWTFSGGNQQKLIVGRWLTGSVPVRVLVVDEPTVGVDVGARADMYRGLQRLADEGVAVLLCSSEPEEIRALAHRAVVLHKGRAVGELAHGSIDERSLLTLAHHVTTGAT